MVVTAIGPSDDPFLLWVLMITAAANRRWDGDVAIPANDGTGLPVACVVRTAKIASIDAGRAERRGTLSPELLAEVDARVTARFAM